MGCIPSKDGRLSSYEKERIESILSKPLESITNNDIDYLSLCVKQFEQEDDKNKPFLLISNINNRLEEIQGHKIAPAISEYDIAVANIKSQVRKLKNKIKQMEGEKEMYKAKALEAKSTDMTTALRNVQTAKTINTNMERTYQIIERLEHYLYSLNEAQVTKEMVGIMTVVSKSLDSIHNEIGSTEQVEELISRLDGYKMEIDEVQDVMEMSDDETLLKLEEELDQTMAKQEMQELNDIVVPTTHISQKEEKIERKKRIAELE